MKKEKILAQIVDWQERNNFLQNKKAELEREILFVNIKLNELTVQYDELCKKLLK